MTRPICPKCNKEVCAINYLKNGIHHIGEVVMNAVKRKLEKNLELLVGKKAGIRKKLYVTCVDSDVCTLLKQ